MLFRTGSSWLRFAVVAGALTAILAIRSSAQIPTEWEWVNPTPHGMQLVDIAMLDESFGIIVCGSGYIMRTWDAGKTWTNTYVINDRFTDMSVTPSGTIFAAVESGAILTSTDRGDSWTTSLTMNGFTYGVDRINMYDDQYGMALLSNNDLFRTSDGGATWDSIQDPLLPSVSIDIVCRTADTWYLHRSSADDIVMTTDFGETWQLEENSMVVHKMTFFSAMEGYRCYRGGMRQTTNGGQSWRDMNLAAEYIVDIRRGGPGNCNLYVLSRGEGTFHLSTDNGDTWSTVIQDGMFESTYAVGCAFSETGTGIIIGAAGFIARSENGGITWDIVHGLGYGGVIYDLHFPTGSDGIAACGYSVLTTNDAGQTWTEHPGLDTARIMLVRMVSVTEGFAVGLSLTAAYRYYHTIDGGTTWEEHGYITSQHDDSPAFVAYQLQIQGEHVFISSSKGRLAISTDGGHTFESKIATTIFQSNAKLSGIPMESIPEGTLVYMGYSGIAMSTDYGETWTNRSHDRFHKDMTDISFYSTSEGYAIIDSALVFTNDGGETWSDDILDHCAKVQFWNRNCGVVWRAQHNGDYMYHEVAATTDGGSTWSHRSMGEAPTWRRWHWATSELGFGYGLYGEIRRTTTSGVTPVQPTPILPASLRLDAFYPNPVSLSRHTGASMRLTLPAGAPQHITVSVYDMLGRKTEIAYRGFMDAGAHIVSIPQSAFRLPGLYTVAVCAGEKRVTKRVVVVE